MNAARAQGRPRHSDVVVFRRNTPYSLLPTFIMTQLNPVPTRDLSIACDEQ